jgi:hypothetical protein
MIQPQHILPTIFPKILKTILIHGPKLELPIQQVSMQPVLPQNTETELCKAEHVACSEV